MLAGARVDHYTNFATCVGSSCWITSS